jgi:glycosyltransferase involved in cell wall biosynthesis
LRVVFYYRFLGLGGVEASLLNRIEALRHEGVECEYWFSKFFGTGAEYITRRDYVRQVETGGAGLIDELKNFDVVVIIDFPQLVTALEQSNINVPVIFESHASFPPALERYYAVLGSKIIRAIVVPSTYNQSLIRNSAKSIIDPIVIPNCIDPEKFLSNRKSVALADLESWSGPVILWVGRLEDEKNPAEMLLIAKALCTDRPDICFVMVGDTPDYDEYINSLDMSLETGIPNSVNFIRHVKFDEMAYLYLLAARSGGLLLATSKFESSPMTFIEAMACGCPVLSSDVGGVGELLRNGQLGFLYQFGDIDSAAKKINQLTKLQSKNEREALIKNAVTYVNSIHAPVAIAKQYNALLKRVAVQ